MGGKKKEKQENHQENHQNHQGQTYVLMFLSGKHCRKKETLTSMAKRFGLKISGLNMAEYKLGTNLKSDKTLQRKVKNIKKLLSCKR